jgi:hypothetical protein
MKDLVCMVSTITFNDDSQERLCFNEICDKYEDITCIIRNCAQKCITDACI